MGRKLGVLEAMDKYMMPIIKAAAKAKTHSKHEMRKVSAAKRATKWRQINTRAIKEYHAWIEEELQKLKRRDSNHGRKKGK